LFINGVKDTPRLLVVFIYITINRSVETTKELSDADAPAKKDDPQGKAKPYKNLL